MPSTSAADAVRDALSRFGADANPAPAAPAAPAPAPAAPAAPKTPTKRVSYPRPNGEKYYARMVNSSIHDVEFLRKNRGETLGENLYTLLFGEPGTGKSSLVEAAFPNLITLSGDGDTTTDDFVGSWVQNPDGTYSWVDGPLIEAMEGGLPFFIDEVALIDSKVMSIVYSAMDGRGEVRIKTNPARGIVKAQPGFYVVGACNPHAPGARMSEALLSRFSVHIEATTDFDLAKALGVPTKMITVAKNLESKRSSGEVSWSPQMRECLNFLSLSKRFDSDSAVANLIGIAPEDDRPIVADVCSRAWGAAMGNLRQGEAAVA